MKKGLELEFWVVDQEGSLTTAAPLVNQMEECAPEFVDPLLEIKTPPQEDIEDIRSTVKDIMTQVLDHAEEQGKGLVPHGTTLSREEVPRLSYDRGDIQAKILGNRISYAKNVAGTHIHFDQEKSVDQLNLLTALDPALALTNSAPYYDDKIAAGARSLIYRNRCYEEFPQHGQLWQYTDSQKEWEDRQQKRFEEFRKAAISEGVESDTFDSTFEPGDTIWTPVRLREEFGTVEWRAPDTTLPSQTLALVEDVGEIMDKLQDREITIGDEPGINSSEISLPSFDALQTLTAHAIHQGLQASDVAQYLRNLGFSVNQYEPVSRRIGDQNKISKTGAKRLRRVWAKKLEEDVENL